MINIDQPSGTMVMVATTVYHGNDHDHQFEPSQTMTNDGDQA